LYGGTGHPSDGDTEDQETDFMFPGDTDPCGWGQGGIPMTSYARYPWTEEGDISASTSASASGKVYRDGPGG
jgi:hypothetical protein